MARTWLSIRVDLVEGGGHATVCRAPGGSSLRTRSRTFAPLADPIDDVFAGWDRAHLHCFDLADALLTGPYAGDEPPDNSQPSQDVRLSRLGLGSARLHLRPRRRLDNGAIHRRAAAAIDGTFSSSSTSRRPAFLTSFTIRRVTACCARASRVLSPSEY